MLVQAVMNCIGFIGGFHQLDYLTSKDQRSLTEMKAIVKMIVWYNSWLQLFKMYVGQIIATSHDLTPKGS